MFPFFSFVMQPRTDHDHKSDMNVLFQGKISQHKHLSESMFYKFYSEFFTEHVSDIRSDHIHPKSFCFIVLSKIVSLLSTMSCHLSPNSEAKPINCKQANATHPPSMYMHLGRGISSRGGVVFKASICPDHDIFLSPDSYCTAALSESDLFAMFCNNMGTESCKQLSGTNSTSNSKLEEAKAA